jgi:hypothetical protein
VPAFFRDHTPLHDDNLARIPDAGQAVGDDKRSAPLHQPVERLEQERLGSRIECGGGLIENEDGRILEERTIETRYLSPPEKLGRRVLPTPVMATVSPGWFWQYIS